ncbi:MAG: bifunctional riboflavin kinase/FAD synthetase [Acidimicrobiia bacterium]
MEVIFDTDRDAVTAGGTAVTIGAFDGVHLGHRALIAALREQASAIGVRSAVVTFDIHPASVVRPESAPLLLTDLDQKLELLADTGVDYTYVVRFDPARAAQSAEEFVIEDLIERLDVRLVTVGADFHFGAGRAGNVALLQRMGDVLGFEVVGHELVDVEGRASSTSVSSTRIRAALRDGDLVAATAMLGRPHEVRGVVGRGDGRARELGFRTANVGVPPEICLPADGIYAGAYLTPDGIERPCAISLGRRPTFYENADASVLEAHLLDFEADLYGQKARVRFIEWLRSEVKFDSVDALIAQMGADVEQCRRILGR